jgi:cell division protein FtsQ
MGMLGWITLGEASKDRWQAWFDREREVWYARAGLVVERLYIHGVPKKDHAQILAALELPLGTPWFRVDLHGLSERLSSLVWVESVTLRVLYPQSLVVAIEKKQPIGCACDAVCRKAGGAGSVVDRTGRLWSGWSCPPGLPWLEGEGAAEAFPALHRALKAHSWECTRAVRLGNRRWDFWLAPHGTWVRLPEHEWEVGLLRLRRLMDRRSDAGANLARVDVRFPGKLLVRFYAPMEEKIQESGPAAMPRDKHANEE